MPRLIMEPALLPMADIEVVKNLIIDGLSTQWYVGKEDIGEYLDCNNFGKIDEEKLDTALQELIDEGTIEKTNEGYKLKG